MKEIRSEFSAAAGIAAGAVVTPSRASFGVGLTRPPPNGSVAELVGALAQLGAAGDNVGTGRALFDRGAHRPVEQIPHHRGEEQAGSVSSRFFPHKNNVENLPAGGICAIINVRLRQFVFPPAVKK